MKKFKFLSVSLCTTVLLLLTHLFTGCSKAPSTLSPLPRGMAPGHSGRSISAAQAWQVPVGNQELWVLVRNRAPQPTPEDAAGSGSLLAKVEEKEVPMPLKHTEVDASVSGYIGTVNVRQEFANPYSSKIEAVYVFPLPHNAAVNEFVMSIGDRHIRGIIRERSEAEQIYRDAKRQGYVASLLTEERPNIFRQSVANIEPGKRIDIRIRYFQTLEYVDGWYEFVFPMVVGPRFNPPGMTKGIGAAARTQSGTSGQTTEVSYLAPGERTAHDISLKLQVDPGVAIEESECRTHRVVAEKVSNQKLVVSLDNSDRLPNKDFVFRYRVAGTQLKSAWVSHTEERGGFFTLMLYPPREMQQLRRQPLELVFVLDSSGSMYGKPLNAAKTAVEKGLSLLEPGDSFQLVNFSMSASQLGDRPLEVNEENIALACRYLHSLQGGGGTMMLRGIEAALDFPHDPERLRFVCFLTDGYIGNETEILNAIHLRLGASRIFSFGIGSAVNRYLMDQMAKEGKGAVAYLGPNDSAPEIMADFFRRISHPALTDLQVDWGGLKVTEVFPRTPPDLFVGRPVLLTGRFSGSPGATIRVNGRAGGQPLQVSIPTDSETTTQPALPNLWARMKIADLAAESIRRPDAAIPDTIKNVALDYGLLSAFTAFVAVDSTRVTEGSEGTKVPVAVPVPEGVKYDTTVPKEKTEQ